MSVYLYFPVVDSSLVEIPQIGINAFLDEGDNNAAKYVDTSGDVHFFATSNNPFSIGTLATPITLVSGTSGLSVYVNDATADVAGISSACTNYITSDGDNGGGGAVTSLFANYSIVESLPASDITKIYGGYFGATAQLGSALRTDAVGVFSAVAIDIAVGGDCPGRYIAGVIGQYSTDGVNPVIDIYDGFRAAIAGVVTGEDNTAPDAAVMAYALTGAGTPGTIDAAFKAVSQEAGRFTYGLDLYGTTNPIGTADIRLSTGATIKVGAGAPAGTPEVGSVYLRTDGAGAAEVLYVYASTGWAALS
jgi:hypothetical protein